MWMASRVFTQGSCGFFRWRLFDPSLFCLPRYKLVEPTHLKNMLVMSQIWIISPRVRGDIFKKIFELPPPSKGDVQKKHPFQKRGHTSQDLVLIYLIF